WNGLHGARPAWQTGPRRDAVSRRYYRPGLRPNYSQSAHFTIPLFRPAFPLSLPTGVEPRHHLWSGLSRSREEGPLPLFWADGRTRAARERPPRPLQTVSGTGRENPRGSAGQGPPAL